MISSVVRFAGLMSTLCVLLVILPAATAQTNPQAASNPVSGPLDCDLSSSGSPFIPVDSWIYPAMMRLYSFGYVDDVYIGMRPWTAARVSEMLDEAADRLSDESMEEISDSTEEEATSIYQAIRHQLHQDGHDPCGALTRRMQVGEIYSRTRIISGTPLRDSFHLGSSVINDYGRPYESGVNNYSGLSGYASLGRWLLYARGEFQGAPSAAGYSAAMSRALSGVDGTTYTMPNGIPYSQTTIPAGPVATVTRGRFLEAYISTQVLNHTISFGKQDEWLGPAMGGSMAYSNNAENIYALHINRSEPLYIPLLSTLTGPFRYEFMLGALRGHTLMPNPLYTPGSSTQANVVNPGDPWMHLEKVSFKPTTNLEFGFERTAFFGGEGHSPVTLHTFLKSFFSTSAPSPAVKNSRNDPGARFAAFDFSYRLPFLRNWVTLYADGEVHDDVSPIDAPRRASWRPGIYLTHVPRLPRLDLRAEAATTDPPVSTSNAGRFMYWETIERQGYTNQGQLFGDWIGREDKGGQAWITYHLSGNEWIQLRMRTEKAAKDFIPGSAVQTYPGTTVLLNGGTTISDLGLEMEKRIRRDVAVRASFTAEHWKAPIYLTGEQTVTTTGFELRWYPGEKLGSR